MLSLGAKETLGCDPFSRVGACGRRPSESADPGVRRVGSFTGAGIGCTIERKLYGGEGWGLLVSPRCPPRSSRLVVLPWGNEGFRFGDEYGLRMMSKEAFGGLPESFCELQGGPKWFK